MCVKKLAYAPQDILSDSKLSLTAKAIYALLFVKSQGRQFVQVSREEIVKELHITRNTYHNHLNLLLERGYVQRLPQPNYQRKFEPAVLRIPTHNSSSELLWDNSIMYSPLPVRAKGLYAYICGIAKGSDLATLNQRQILTELNIERNLYLKYRNQLLDGGAIGCRVFYYHDEIMRPGIRSLDPGQRKEVLCHE